MKLQTVYLKESQLDTVNYKFLPAYNQNYNDSLWVNFVNRKVDVSIFSPTEKSYSFLGPVKHVETTFYKDLRMFGIFSGTTEYYDFDEKSRIVEYGFIYKGKHTPNVRMSYSDTSVVIADWNGGEFQDKMGYFYDRKNQRIHEYYSKDSISWAIRDSYVLISDKATWAQYASYGLTLPSYSYYYTFSTNGKLLEQGEFLHDSITGGVTTKEAGALYEYDSNGCKSKYTIIRQDQDHVETFVNDKFCNRIEWHSSIMANNSNLYYLYKYDSFGNWISKESYKINLFGPHTFAIEKREIKYY